MQKDKVEEKVVKGNDELLMERIMKVVNKHLSDSDFKVDVLTEEVGISRAQLHRKMKEMTGLSVTEFIRHIRLEQAFTLLSRTDTPVGAVAAFCGFRSHIALHWLFKKRTGMSMSEWRKRNRHP